MSKLFRDRVELRSNLISVSKEHPFPTSPYSFRAAMPHLAILLGRRGIQVTEVFPLGTENLKWN